MKSKLLFLVFTLFAWSASAQQLVFSNLPRINARSNYNKVIGENASGIFIIRFRQADLSRGFDLELYSHNLDFITERSVKLNKNERLIKVATTDSGLALLVLKQKGFSAEVELYKLNNQLELNGKSQTIYSSLKVNNSENAVDAEFSTNNQSFGIAAIELSEDGFAAIKMSTFTVNGTPLSSSTIKTITKIKNIELVDLTLSNSHEFCLLFSSVNPDKKYTDPSANQYTFAYLSASGKSGYKEINAGKYFISAPRLMVNEFDKQIRFVAFYSFKNPGENTGIAYGTWSSQEEKLSVLNVPIDRKLVAMVIGSGNEKKGEDLSNFFFRKLVPRSDGGLLAVAEKYSVSQQMETFYVNGIPQTSSRNIYNYDDIIVFTFDSSGNMEWKHHIPKRQNSLMENNYFSSVAVSVNEDQINIVYNENPGQSNRVLLIKLLRDGSLEQRILLKSDNLYTAIVPFESKQTGYNRLIVPLMQNRQIYLLKIITGQE